MGAETDTFERIYLFCIPTRTIIVGSKLPTHGGAASKSQNVTDNIPREKKNRKSIGETEKQTFREREKERERINLTRRFPKLSQKKRHRQRVFCLPITGAAASANQNVTNNIPREKKKEKKTTDNRSERQTNIQRERE